MGNGRFPTVLAAMGLLAGACDQPTAPSPLRGFVSLVDGRAGVVDLRKMSAEFSLKPSTRGVQEAAVFDAGRELYTGDPNTDQIVHYRVGDDLPGSPEMERLESPVYINAVASDRRAGASATKFVVTSRVPFLWDLVVPTTTKPQDSIAVYDLATQAWQGTCKLRSPARGVVVGNRFYVANVHDKTVAEVNLDDLTVVHEERVGAATWPTRDGMAVGPKMVAVSHDGRWLASADYEALSISVFDLQNSWARQTVAVPAVVRSVAFSPDDKQLWAVSYGLTIPYQKTQDDPSCCVTMGAWYDGPQPANEASNAYRATTVHVFDFPSLSPVTQFSSDEAGQEVIFSPDGSEFYLTTSAGTVLSYNTAAMRPSGEAVVGGVGFPILCGGLEY